MNGPAARDIAESESVPAAELQPLLERILNSKYFATAGRKRKFLSVVCDYYLKGSAKDLTEFSLACEVFGRDASYDPGQDPSVRVCAHEVRKKLAAYYAHEGAAESLIIEIPVGAYRPVFRRRIPEPAPELAEPAPARRTWILAVAACALIAAILAATWMARRTKPRARDTVWKSFFEDASPTLAVISNPPVFQFLYESDPVHLARDAVSLTAGQMAGIEKTLGKGAHRLPFLVSSPDDYTGVGEALSLAQIARFFALAGREVVTKQSRTTSAEDLKTHHAILIGGPLFNAWTRGSGTLDFDLSENFVINRNPQPGEQREYRLAVDESTGEPATDWAVISFLPNISPGKDMMMLMGIRGEGCQAAGEFVTNDRYLDQLQRKLSSGSDPPRYFQALLRVDIKNRIPTNISLVAVHPLTLSSSDATPAGK